MSSYIGSTSGAITFTGLGSGTDFDKIIEALIDAESYNIDLMESWKADWEEKIESIEGLNTRVFALYEACDSYNEDFEFFSRTASSSNTSVLSVLNTPQALPGAHSVEVASSVHHMFAGRGFNASTAVVGGSTGENLTITVGSETVTLTYGSNYAAGQWDVSATLADFVNIISAADAAAGDFIGNISIIDDGSSKNTQRLVMTSKTAGSDYRITVSSDPTSLGLDGSGQYTVDSVVENVAGWTGSAYIDPTGSDYTGHTNKRFTFTIQTDLDDIDASSATITWTDTEGNTGNFTINGAGSYSVYQGVELYFSNGTEMSGDDMFTLDVYNTTIQEGQNNGLAQTHQITFAGHADADTTPITYVSTGVFSYTYAGVEYSISLGDDATLTDLVTEINNAGDNPGVTASIMNDGQGLATSYHLVLTGGDTGAAYQISNVTMTDINNFDQNFTVTRKAQNSMLKVDGYPTDAEAYIQRSSNRITDLIDSVELRLNSVGEATVSIENNKSAVAQKITEWVNAVNYVLEYIHTETKYDDDTKEVGIMFGNYAFNIVQSKLKNLMTSSIPGLDRDEDVFTHLSQIGIQSDPDNYGYFTIDLDALDTALDDNMDAVAKMFVEAKNVGGVDGVMELMRQETDDLTDEYNGPMNVLVSNYSGIVDNIDAKIDREYIRVALVESRLKDQFARLEETLTILNAQKDSLDSQIAQLTS